MNITAERTQEGITERLFELTVGDHMVPGALWTPAGPAVPRALVLIGHGGGMHRTAPPVLGAMKRYVTAHGYAVAAIDAPEHGARLSPEEAPLVAQRIRDRITRSGGMRGEALAALMLHSRQMLEDWKATLNAIQQLDVVGTAGPVGYQGVSHGTWLGIPFLAAEPRVTAAVLGFAGIHGTDDPLVPHAQKITIPLQFAMQWDDEMTPREEALALFAAFASREKTLHANAGSKSQVPAFERASWETFFGRHLADK